MAIIPRAFSSLFDFRFEPQWNSMQLLFQYLFDSESFFIHLPEMPIGTGASKICSFFVKTSCFTVIYFVPSSTFIHPC